MTVQKHDPSFCPKIILGVVAHPDDLEFCLGGSLAKWVSQGAKAYYLVLTSGGKGSADRDADTSQVGKTRQAEQKKAAELLGVSKVFFCDYEDGQLEVNRHLKKDIVRIIRTVRPDVVFTMDPTLIYSSRRGALNHPDHRAVGQATLDAVYPLARDHLSFPELLSEEHLEPHKVATVLLWNLDKANFYVDITDHLDTKLAALTAHGSQIPGMNEAQQRIHELASECGKQINVTYAEQFVRIDVDTW